MSYPNSYRLGPAKTPRPLKILVLMTFVISLVSALFDRILPLSPQQILSLSLDGMESGFLWQLATYLFVHPLSHGLSFSFLLSLAFDLYVLWVIGTSLIERKGINSFFSLYFLSGIVSGFAIYGMQWLTQSPIPFSGNWTSIYAVLIAWLMLYPGMELLLFLTVPVKAKWLILGTLGANLLIDFSTGDFVHTTAYLTAAFTGYFYAILFWSTKTESHRDQYLYPRAKVYDFKTGRAILNDNEFLEAMLTKVSLHGKESLTWKERWRLRGIHRKKRAKK